MLGNSFTWYIFAFTLFELVIKTHLTFYDSSHGFISKNPRYFEDDFSNIHEDISLRYTQKPETPKSKWKLRLEPEILDFKQRPLGMPHLETVTFFNEDSQKTIDMTSISGNTVHFHSSFFEDKKIPPNGNTSFKVVFLGRNEGPVESNLFIHTSDGFMKYNVKAFGSFSPYRLRPIVGVKVPVNSTFSPLIYMHNPHSEPIQIVEIYSSGGGFHLELPSGKQEGPNDMWEILPQETKAIIRVGFHAKTVQNHTAYIRIKLLEPDEILIVPVEVEVTSTPSIFYPQGSVDFGMGGDMDPPKEVDFCLFNPTKKSVRVHSVSTVSKAIKAQYYNIRVSPGTEKENVCVHIGTLTLDWRTAWKNQDYHGKIIVKFQNGRNRTEIPYHLSVLRGSISYDTMATTYFLNDKGIDLSMRSFEARNEYQHPIKIMNVTFPFDADSIFKVETFTPKIIQPKEKQNLFNIKLKNSVKKSDMTLSSYITLHTNISEITVPLLSYNGKLQAHLPFRSKDYSLDVGLIACSTKKEVYFLLANPNPVSLQVTNIKSSIPMTRVEIYGCGAGDHKDVLLQHTSPNLTECRTIKSKSYMVIKITVSASQIEGQVWGDINIETPFEILSVPVHFRISHGKFEVGGEKFNFDNCFPGKICSHPLKVTSTFEEKMIIEDIMSIPDDIRMSYTHTTLIPPKSSRILGHLFIAPHLDCDPNCYTGFSGEYSGKWLKTLANPAQMAEYDSHLVNLLYNRFLNVTINGSQPWENLTFRIDTTEIRGHIFKSRVKLVWPTLLIGTTLKNDSVLEFPLTQVGNFSTVPFLLHNPASCTIIVQLMFDKHYPEVGKLVLPPKILSPLEQSYTPSSSFEFQVPESIKTQQDFFFQTMKIRPLKSTLSFIMASGQTEEIKIKFHAKDTQLSTGMLLLRNNLTVLEVIKLEGRGAMPMFKFGNRKPGSEQPLRFEMTEKHLKDCDATELGPNPQLNLSVKRGFVARNVGDVAIQVHKFFINNYECEGYGFKVIDCEPFVLPPHSTKKIDIAFTPDLTLTKVTRTLILRTSLNIPVNYTLYTTIPADYLVLCEDLIGRPFWEVYLSYVFIILMTSLFLGTVLIAILDAESIKMQVFNAFVSSKNASVQPVLDLRKVGQQTKEEIQGTKDRKKEDGEENHEEKKSPNEPAIIPTTGKGKKKLAQKNSCDSVEGGEIEEEKDSRERERERRPRKKEIMYERHRLKSRERKDEKEMRIMEEKERKERQLQLLREKEQQRKHLINKKSPKNIPLVVTSTQEEETSSTTTESSSNSNCEDAEKENQKQKSKAHRKDLAKPKDKNTNTTNPTSEPGGKHVSFVNSKFKQAKVLPKPKDIEKKEPVVVAKESKDLELSLEKPSNPHHHNHNKYHIHIREVKKRENKAREKREKLVYRNKNERKQRTSESETDKEKRKSPNSFYVPLPAPSTTISIWGESRAKFSDVVARNDSVPLTESTSTCDKVISSTVITPTPKLKAVKPTMYVEPYKANKVELGPIGSKRTEMVANASNVQVLDNLLEDNTPVAEENNCEKPAIDQSNMNVGDYDNSIIAAISSSGNSFFSGLHDLQIDIEPSQQAKAAAFLNDFTTPADTWNRQQPEFRNVLTEEDRIRTPTPTKVEDSWSDNLPNPSSYWSSNTNLMDSSEPPAVPSNSNYLWGTNPVWQLWAPLETPATPRRTPPGFDQLQQRNNEQPPRDNYNQFGGIWPQNKPWNYDNQQ